MTLPIWRSLGRDVEYVKPNNVYLETSRDIIIADEASLDAAKKYFLSK